MRLLEWHKRYKDYAKAPQYYVTRILPILFLLYYIKNQLDATLAVLFISHCKINLHVSDAFCVHHQAY